MIKFIFVFCLLLLPSINTLANTSPTQCAAHNGQESLCKNTAGCQYIASSNDCAPCASNQYSNAGDVSCTNCPSSHPSSEVGADINQCYKTCPNIPISNGTKTAGNATYNNDCNYIITCDAGYTQNGDACEPEQKLCANLPGSCEGLISGNAKWLATQNHWDYSECSCTADITLTNGTATKTCKYTGEETDKQWQCTTTVTSCNPGYCEVTGLSGYTDAPGQCKDVPKGYYHSNASDKKCEPCPMGSTSDKGAAARSACYIHGGTAPNKEPYTQFCDANGQNCFTLDKDYHSN